VQIGRRDGEFDPNDRTYADLAGVYEYWLGKQAGRLAPSWADINLMDLPSTVIPRICVVDVTPDKRDFIYRFWGTAITGIHHYDLSGKSIRLLKPADYADTIYQQYQSVYDTREPKGFLTEIPLGSGLFTYYATVRMPLSSDGHDVDSILSAEDYGDNRDQIRINLEKLVEPKASDG